MKFFKQIDKISFIFPAVLSIIVLMIGIVSPASFGKIVNSAFAWTTKNFSWFFAIGTTFLMFFAIWAGFSRYGNIRFGGEDAKPDISFPAWIAITFTSGMALGVVFYGVGEPLLNFMSPPDFLNITPGSKEMAEQALSYTFIHWCFQPYGIYTSCGLVYAFVYWNTKRKFEISSALYPVIGEKSSGILGKLINGLCLYIMVATLGTNVGMATLQFITGFEYVFNTNYSDIIMQISIVAALAIIWIVAACTGIHKGIKYISSFNMYIFIVLVLWAFLFGDTIFILNNTVTSIGKYFATFIPQAFYLESALQTGWVSRWTIFYWAWWLTVTPLTGLFLSRLAKGRTIKEFVLVNMIIPVVFIFIWFGTFGSSAISRELAGFNIWHEVEAFGFPVALFAYLNTIPLKSIVILLGFIAIFCSFITQAEAMTYTMAGMSVLNKTSDSSGEQKSPIFLKIFWGVAIALMGFVLIQSGGLESVQISVVICGLPILLLLIINSIGFIKMMFYRNKYDLTLKDKK